MASKIVTLYNKLRNRRLYRIFEKKIFPTLNVDIGKYNSAKPKKNEKIIWTMWWTGKMPKIVEICINSMIKNSKDYDVVVITKHNYQQYISIPEYIIEKVENHKITITHLSDIMRAALLSEHGGAWLDSTVFVSQKIPDECTEANYYSLHEDNIFQEYIPMGKWAGNLQFTKASTHIPLLLKDCLYSYWLKNDKLFFYFIIDLIMLYGYNHVAAIKESIDSINPEISKFSSYNDLNNILNKEYNQEELNKVLNSAIFFKLSWKQKYYEKTSKGKYTNYYYLLKNYSNN